MSAEALPPPGKPAADPPVIENAKYRQILAGARRVFLAHGFEGASVNEIAKEAGVSKSTLYVYFENKERLFAAIVDEPLAAHVENIFEFDYDSSDVEGTLLTISEAITSFICQPRLISAMRAVMGITDRMPDIGAHFYNAGSGHSRKQLAKYLDMAVAAGQLDIDDTELAAAQFLEMSHGPLLKPMFFRANNTLPTSKRIRQVAQAAVRVFMAGYAVKK